MLIIKRRLGEKLIIGDGVTATVLKLKGHQVRIGIDAPPQVRIQREETLQPAVKERES